MPHTLRAAASVSASRGRAVDVAADSAATFAFSGSTGLAALKGQEWLLANGLGGLAMGTASGVPTRRYHGLLVTSLAPPVRRVLALSAMVERAEVEGAEPIEFSSFAFNPHAPMIHPDGHTRLVSFACDESCRWRWEATGAGGGGGGGGVELSRELAFFRGRNAAGLRYTLHRMAGAAKSRARIRLTIRPLIALRDMHALIHRAESDRFAVRAGQSGVEVQRDGLRVSMELAAGAATFIEDQQWWHDFLYEADAARGQECAEDLFSPGVFELELSPGVNEVHADLVAWVAVAEGEGAATGRGGGGEIGDRPRHSIEEELAERRQRSVALGAAVCEGCDERDHVALRVLARAADAFVVARMDAAGGLSGVSTIAGYPWFSDWGRDAFIALPGLLLAAGRHEEALRQLSAFARARRHGIIPNVFDDRTGEPEFNTVDASLWFVHAACRWLEATGDRAAFDRELRDACADVIRHYRQGTDHGIAMDPIDRLITAGSAATQLTWMDARRDGVTFTPRHGKAVEINALWYNALRSLAGAVAPADGAGAANLNDLADAVRKSFVARFWNERERCLFDVLTPTDGGQWAPDASIRPNQLLAVSLPHSMLDARKQRDVVSRVRERLLTPMGVRTLDPADPRYRGRYEGNLFERDGAYHQGTAWPWLLGPLAEGVLRAGSFDEASKAEARRIIEPVLSMLVPGECAPREGTCAGQIAEVFDGDGDAQRPQRAGGCPAQAWSVAELLRVQRMISRGSPTG